MAKALTVQAVKDQFHKAGAEPAPGTGRELGTMVAAETARWTKVVTDNKLKAE
ncbi:hypothetical protein LP417_33155 (plasmid) [Polaromonas sp. P1-6]|nr:hypothetical protein LP417_33155 [Polaromonas sp. P1-6]